MLLRQRRLVAMNAGSVRQRCALSGWRGVSSGSPNRSRLCEIDIAFADHDRFALAQRPCHTSGPET